MEVQISVNFESKITHEFQEWWNDGRVVNLLDDEDRQGRLVPGQTLGRRVLNRPKKKGDVKHKYHKFRAWGKIK